MIAPDVNVLLYAFREDADRHVEYRSWLQSALNGSERVALFEPVLAATVRIGTHPAIYRPPTPRQAIEAFIDACLAAPAAVRLRPETGHWALFRNACTRADCRGNLVQDACLAAAALEHDCVFMTTDRDFSRFAGLRWRHPLDELHVTENPR